MVVDGDCHTFEQIQEAINYLKREGRNLRIRLFAAPGRADNKEWQNFMSEHGVIFRPVKRNNHLHQDSNDEAIIAAMSNFCKNPQVDKVALLTSDSDFVKPIREINKSGTDCVVFVPENKFSPIREFKAAGARTVKLKCENKLLNVRAILHDIGAGSVLLEPANPVPRIVLPQNEYDARIMVIKRFLQESGYGEQQEHVI